MSSEQPKTALRQRLEQLSEAQELIVELRAVGIFLHLADSEKVRLHTTTETAMTIAQIRAVKRLDLGIRCVLRAEGRESA